MKNIICLVAVLMGTSAFAKDGSKSILICSDGEQTNLKLLVSTTGEMRADLTVQSVGDSYPTYHYKNVNKLRSFEPIQYENQNGVFKLILNRATSQQTKKIKSYLTASDIGINSRSVNCAFL